MQRDDGLAQTFEVLTVNHGRESCGAAGPAILIGSGRPAAPRIRTLMFWRSARYLDYPGEEELVRTGPFGSTGLAVSGGKVGATGIK